MNDTSSPNQSQEVAAEPTGRQALLLDIGHKLTLARKSSRESIEEAVRTLKLQKRHINALESGNWDQMPDDIYVLGFLRQYSQYLHIDLSDEMHRLKNDQYALTKPLTFPDPPVAPSRRWAWIAGTAFVLLFIMYNVTTDNDDNNPANTTESSLPSSDMIQTRHQSDLALQTISDTKPAVETTMSTTIATSGSATKNATIGHSAPIITTHTSTLAKEIEQTVNQATAQTQPAIATIQMQPAHSMIHHFRFDAVGSPVWLQIFSPNQTGIGKGRLLKEVLLQPSTYSTINARTKSLWITCGNAPALRISVDGTVFADQGSLGAGKKILRDYRFTIASDN